MKATPGLILIGALGPAVALAFGYAWVENPAPPPIPAAFAVAASPAHPEGDSSPGSGGAADGPAVAGESLNPIADSETPARSWPVSSSGPAPRAGAPAALSSQEQALQAPRVESAAYGSAGVAPGAPAASGNTGAPGTRPLFDAGSAPLIPIPASGQVPLAFRPLAPALSTANPQLASGLQTLQQNFVNALSGQYQNPNDPGYAARWDAAQWQSDQQYKILVGNQNYLIEQESLVGKADQ